MEFFHEPNIDWLGKKWYFISVSLLLLVAGLVSIAVHHGLLYGIEFRSGTQVMVKFAKAPDIGAIRKQLNSQNWRGASIQTHRGCLGTFGDDRAAAGRRRKRG